MEQKETREYNFVILFEVASRRLPLTSEYWEKLRIKYDAIRARRRRQANLSAPSCTAPGIYRMTEIREFPILRQLRQFASSSGSIGKACGGDRLPVRRELCVSSDGGRVF